MTHESQQGKFTGRHMLYIMVAFFAVIITVNFTMATFASRSWTGLVVKNSYVESQKFNAELERSRKQASLGWVGTLSRLDSGVGFSLQDGDGAGVIVDRISVTFKRPATEIQDHSINLAAKAAGQYQGNVELAQGRWTASVGVFSSGQRKWRMDYHIMVKSDHGFVSVSNKDTGEK